MEKYLKSKSPGKTSVSKEKTSVAKDDGDNAKVSKDLEPFEEFAEGLGSWRAPLDKFVKTKTFQDIYKFIKEEYAGKKVHFRASRSIPRWTISSTHSD